MKFGYNTSSNFSSFDVNATAFVFIINIRSFLMSSGHNALHQSLISFAIHILNSAVTNGFVKKLVDKKITNFGKFKQINETTTLSTLDKDVTYKKFTYHPWTYNKFNKIFRHHNTVLTPQN